MVEEAAGFGSINWVRSPRFHSKSASFQSIGVGGPAATEFQNERGCADSGVVVGLAGCQWVNGFKMALAFCFCSAARYVVSRLSELAMSESE